MDSAVREQLFFFSAASQLHLGSPGEERTYLRRGIIFNFRYRPLRNDMPALCARLGSHLNYPVRFL